MPDLREVNVRDNCRGGLGKQGLETKKKKKDK